jgi:hypothetical protein
MHRVLLLTGLLLVQALSLGAQQSLRTFGAVGAWSGSRITACAVEAS